MLAEDGVKMLKQILGKHSCHRPPFSILVFSEAEVTLIVNYMLRTFFRHYSLYEYSFKPKVDIVLMTMPKGGLPTGEQGTADKLQKTEEVPENHTQSPMHTATKSEAAEISQDQDAASSPSQHIDWEKVGKIYKPESAIEHIVSKEMDRLKQGFEQNI